jgi:hypothetical protein
MAKQTAAGKETRLNVRLLINLFINDPSRPMNDQLLTDVSKHLLLHDQHTRRKPLTRRLCPIQKIPDRKIGSLFGFAAGR